MSEVKEYGLKYIPTGIVFRIPLEDAIAIMKTDRGNYEAVDFEFHEETPIKETTTYEQVVVKEEPERKKELSALKVSELIAYCDENDIKYSTSDKKADLIEKIIKAEN